MHEAFEHFRPFVFVQHAFVRETDQLVVDLLFIHAGHGNHSLGARRKMALCFRIVHGHVF